MKTMGILRLFLTTVVALLAAMTPGCQSPSVPPQPTEPTVVQGVVANPGSSTTQPESTVATLPSSQTPQSVKVSLNTAPKVGETAELTVRVTQNYVMPSAGRVTRTWVQFMYRNTEGTYREYRNPVEVPMEEVLLGSTADWVGDLRADSPLEFKVPMKLLKPGLWDIAAYAEMDNGSRVFDRIYVGTAADKAGIRGTEADRLGQLEWMKDYRAGGAEARGSAGYQLDTVVDFRSPPELGKPTELRWSVVSQYDSPGVVVGLSCFVSKAGDFGAIVMPVSSVLVAGDLSWVGSLRKGVPVSGSATVIFPEEGDWETVIQCRDSEHNSIGLSGVYFNITVQAGKWGWAESHLRPKDPGTTPTTPPPAPTP